VRLLVDGFLRRVVVAFVLDDRRPDVGDDADRAAGIRGGFAREEGSLLDPFRGQPVEDHTVRDLAGHP
jgi:hypothetical protein